jgi:hypothetical protein
MYRDAADRLLCADGNRTTNRAPGLQRGLPPQVVAAHADIRDVRDDLRSLRDDMRDDVRYDVRDYKD